MASDIELDRIANYIARERIMISVMVDRDGQWTDEYAREINKKGWLFFAKESAEESTIFPNDKDFKLTAPLATTIVHLTIEEMNDALALARKKFAERHSA